MGFEYKIKATLTQTHIAKIENLLQKIDYFERKYWVEDKLFYDFRHPDNVGKMPNASPEQKQAIERRFWQIANFKSSFAGTQHLYDNYLSDILSLIRLKGLQRQIPNYYGDDLVAYRSAIITEAIRVKIANTLTDKNPDIEQKMNQIITNELKALQA